MTPGPTPRAVDCKSFTSAQPDAVRMTSTALFRSLSATAATLAVVTALASCSSEQATPTRTSAPPTASSATTTAGANYTIDDYIRDADINRVVIRRGDATAPSIELPALPGWIDATAQAPDGTYQAVKYTTGITAADYSPNVVVTMSRLTGRSIDTAKLADAAPGELRNLTDFAPIGVPDFDKVDGQRAYKIAGTYRLDDLDAVVAQSTILIPSGASYYLIQISVTGAQSQIDIVKSATRAIDDGVRIRQ